MEKRGFLYKLITWLYKLIDKLGRNLSKASSELNFLKYKIEFGEKEDDIYVVTFPKSGTTLMQMILFLMTTDNEVDFEHIYEVSPWLRNDAFKRNPIKNIPSPRIIKSHDPYSEFDQDIKGKFIHVYRDPMDVAVSLYHQNKNYRNPDLDFDDFFKNFIKDHKMNWFRYSRDWQENKSKLKILFIRYEDLVENLESSVQKIANFIQLDYGKIDMERVRKYSSFEYMKSNQSKFGVQPIEPPSFVYDQFIRKGKSGEGKQQLSEAQQLKIMQMHKHYLGGLDKGH